MGAGVRDRSRDWREHHPSVAGPADDQNYAAAGTPSKRRSGSEERLDDGTLGRTISGGPPSEYVPFLSG
jgi:hypothetical protein